MSGGDMKTRLALPFAALALFAAASQAAEPRYPTKPIRIIIPTAPGGGSDVMVRSEEHTSELQSLRHLVCRLLLEKKKYQVSLRCGDGRDDRAVYLAVW